MATTTDISFAFRELRKRGYTAKQNFKCCQSCAWAALSDKEAERVVFYHNQDADNLKRMGSCYLSWSGDGKEIVEVLNLFGINTEWDGTNENRIKIILK